MDFPNSRLKTSRRKKYDAIFSSCKFEKYLTSPFSPTQRILSRTFEAKTYSSSNCTYLLTKILKITLSSSCSLSYLFQHCLQAPSPVKQTDIPQVRLNFHIDAHIGPRRKINALTFRTIVRVSVFHFHFHSPSTCSDHFLTSYQVQSQRA